MKSMVTAERHSCDTCGGETYDFYACAWCGADVCREHRTEHRRQIYFDSSGDPGACPLCEAKIKADPTLLGPLAEVARLYAELERWNADFKTRKEAAESRAKDWEPPE